MDRRRVIALGLYGFVATLQPDANFGRILAAYGGVFVAGSLAWGMLVDKFRPDRWDVIGALVCLVGVAVIMYAPGPPDRSCAGNSAAQHMSPRQAFRPSLTATAAITAPPSGPAQLQPSRLFKARPTRSTAER